MDIQFKSELVQISLPDVYRRRPLYCTPLYHELGHFIDLHRGVTTRSLISKDHNWPLPGFDIALITDDASRRRVQTSHRMEYFADLFSASFTGKSGREFLQAFAGNQAVSATHPATADRIKVIDDFLTSKPNPIVELFQETLAALTLPSLGIFYTSPNIIDSFDNVRPYAIKDPRELHGIYDAAWSYLCEIWHTPRTQWAQLEQFRREQSVNDLVEKSIRNYMIQEKWSPHAIT